MKNKEIEKLIIELKKETKSILYFNLLLISFYLLLNDNWDLTIKSIFMLLIVGIVLNFLFIVIRLNGPVCTSIIVLDCNLEDAQKKCLDSLKYFKIKKCFHNKEDCFIKANTKMSLRSYGEEIVFNLKKLNTNQTQVDIRIEPIIKLTIFDYGKSRGIAKKINESLRDS